MRSAHRVTISHSRSVPSLSQLHIPRRAHRKDTFISARQQHPFQKPATLIMEEVFIPFVFHKLGDHHDNAAIGMLFRQVQNELNDGNDDEAVG